MRSRESRASSADDRSASSEREAILRAVLQRVSRASVSVAGETVGEIEGGLVVLLGVQDGDTEEDGRWLASKCAQLRIFEDGDGRMNRSVLETSGAVLLISQFTLLADCRKGRRPSFTRAARPQEGEELYEQFAVFLRDDGLTVSMGRFGARMVVELANDGPVTIVIDSSERHRSRGGGSGGV